jgi:hypothetical protein
MSSSPNPSSMICMRTRRTRRTSTCASAMLSAAARRGSLACAPAIRCARSAASAASEASASTGTLNPWRKALRATTALPARVRGPVLRVALARLAARILSFAHVRVRDRAFMAAASAALTSLRSAMQPLGSCVRSYLMRAGLPGNPK